MHTSRRTFRRLALFASSILSSGVSLYSVAPPIARANVIQVSDLYVSINGLAVSKSYSLPYRGSIFIPLYGLMQGLKSLGISTAWNGSTWNITKRGSVNLKGIPSKLSGRIAIVVNKHVIARTYSPNYTLPNGKSTTWISLSIAENVFGRLGFAPHWDKTNFSIWSQKSSPPSVPGSGITDSELPVGDTMETWIQGSQVVMNPITYDPNSNFIPLKGHVTDGYRGTLDISVNTTTDPTYFTHWDYPVTVGPDGTFAATIEEPWKGQNWIQVFECTGDKMNYNWAQYFDGGAQFEATNNAPDVTDLQMGLLTSWWANYDQFTAIKDAATQIVAPIVQQNPPVNPNDDTTSLAYQEAKAISNYVSSNIAYDWTAFLQNNIPDQQSTFTLSNNIGVCQDEAALTAAMLRSLGIPALVRQGEGLPQGLPPASHSWIWFWDGARWVIDDPTWNQVYPQGQKTNVVPSSIDDKYFDPNPAMFAQDHQDHGIDFR